MRVFRIFTVLVCMISIWFQFSEPGLLMIKLVNNVSHYTDWTITHVQPDNPAHSSDWTSNRSLTPPNPFFPILSIIVSLFLIASTLYFTKDTRLRRSLFVSGWLLRVLLNLPGLGGTLIILYYAANAPTFITLSSFIILITLTSILPFFIAIFLPYESKTT